MKLGMRGTDPNGGGAIAGDVRSELSTLSGSVEAATQVIAWYRLRMQIEEGLRDTKSVRYGCGLTQSLTRQPRRLAIPLLIAALAAIACWQIGAEAIARAEHYRWQANTRQIQRVLSVITLGRLILQAASHRSPSG